MKQLAVLIKPASSLCNLRCRYCFYHSIADARTQPSYGIMSRETATALIEKAFACSDSVTFAFQGGEPTLAGVDFFRFFVDEATRLNRDGTKVSYCIQTNGVGMTEAVASFLAERHFLVGLSLDGPREINDWMRVDADGSGSFRPAMEAAALLGRAGVPFNILSVVSAGVARHAAKVYRFLRAQDFRYLQFIPCLDPLDTEPFCAKHSLTPELYAGFLTTLFHLWADDLLAGRGVSIRFFDNLVTVAAGFPPEQCGMLGRCTGQLTVEADGSLFPCDFYCTDSWRIGKISDMTFEQAFASPVMQRFIKTSIYDDQACRQCQYYTLCRGGCRRDRDASSDGSAGTNRYCTALKAFYAEATPRLPSLVAYLRMNRRQGENYNG